MEYRQPKNPKHTNVFSEDDMWWVADAWDETTVEWFINLISTKPPSFFNGISYAWGQMRNFGLPGLLPSGDALAEIVLSFPEVRPELEAWLESHPERETVERLTLPVQLYLCWAEHDRIIFYTPSHFIECLLVVARLSDEDVDFLLKRRKSNSKLDVRYAPAFQNHQLPYDSRNYAKLVEKFFSDWKALAADGLKAERVRLAPAIATNPHTPEEVLRRLVNSSRQELSLVKKWMLAGSKGASKAVTKQFENALGEYDERALRLGYYDYIPTWRQMFSDIEDHPNWTGGSLGFSRAGTPDGYHNQPTRASQEDLEYLVDVDHWDLSSSDLQAWESYALAPFTALRNTAEELIRSPEDADIADLLILAPAVGVIFREQREALGIDAGTVPQDWVSLVF